MKGVSRLNPERWVCREPWPWSDNRWGGYRVWTVRHGQVLEVWPCTGKGSRGKCWIRHPDGTTLVCSYIALSRHCDKEKN